jgi:hypothetical protein
MRKASRRPHKGGSEGHSGESAIQFHSRPEDAAARPFPDCLRKMA